MSNQALIKLSFCYRNHLDEVREYSLQFTSIPDFTNYLRWEPEKAMLIKYGKVDEERIKNSRTSGVKLSVLSEGSQFVFDDAFKFAEFLRSSPMIARDLQYSG
jgi:hypothetical protein